jgi:hypothetical protein
MASLSSYNTRHYFFSKTFVDTIEEYFWGIQRSGRNQPSSSNTFKIWMYSCTRCFDFVFHIFISVTQWSACWYCTTEGLGSNLGTSSIFSERPLERFSNRILSCTKNTPPSYGDLSSKNLRNRTMPVNGNKQWQHQQWSQ